MKRIVIVLMISILGYISFSCDSTDAKYKPLYQNQLAITDSLMRDLNILRNTVFNKVDSLNEEISYLRGYATSLNFELSKIDTAEIIRNFNKDLDPYLFQPLHKRITEIIDSLNRR